MSRGFYNYDTRGASASSQIINLERMVEERDQTIERLREALKMIAAYLDDCGEHEHANYIRSRGEVKP